MSLPVIDTPTFEMNLLSIKDPITYRPFLVKEEKLLLMAMEAGDQQEIVQTSKQIINNCILSKNVNADNLPLFDLQMALLKIRSKSVGEEIEIQMGHFEGKNSKDEECDGTSKIKINLTDLKLTTNKEHSKLVKLTDAISIDMKYPTMSVYNRMSALEDVEDVSTVNELFTVIIDCIDNIYSGDEIFSANDHTKEEMTNFVNSLTSDQFEKLKIFFNTMPALLYDIEFTCSKCNCHEKQTLNGVADFFL
jgi:hypothetical protein